MRFARILTVLIATATLAGAAGTAHAQTMVCGAQNVGQRVCQAQSVCECTQFTGGLMFRDPPGYRWDCSLTRGTCVGNGEMPVLERSTAPLPVTPGARTATSLGSGSSHETIRGAQAALKRRGFDPGSADGVLGSRTRAAIVNFQREQNLPPTGALDAATLNRLRA